jgi:hypothetical protein
VGTGTYNDEEAAQESTEAIWSKYAAYRADEDFVEMDMARKYLQAGVTRAATVVFRDRWQAVLDDPAYERLKARHQQRYAASDCDAMEND